MGTSRILAAFSPVENLAGLVVPERGRLRPIDGLRALAIVWVIAFHSAWHSVSSLPLPMYAELVGAPRMLIVWRGDFGVDLFFVVSGFLIAGMLVDERVRNGRVRLGMFYLRRLLRLWPALVVTVIVDQLAFHDFPRSVWAVLFYATNFVSVSRVCVAWSWSLAIEEQFYLVCPWLLAALVPLGVRGRLLALGALAAGLCVLGAWVVSHHDFHATDAEIVVNRLPHLWISAFDHLYSKPWMRTGPLLAGVAAALVFRAPGAMQALSRATVVGTVALVALLAVAAAATHWQLFASAPRGLEVAYLATYRTVFGVAVACVLLLALSDHPVGRVLGRVLAARVFHPVAQLAYSAYLMNPIVAMALHPRLAERAAQGSPMLVFFTADLLATFAAGLLLYLAVERPLMRLRPR